MKEKKENWQSIRGICILAVVLIHSLGGFNYSTRYGTEFVVLRQIINFAVATFVFMAGYFVCIFRKNCASVPEERSAIPLQTEQSSAG